MFAPHVGGKLGFPLENCISVSQYVKIFACGALVLHTPTPVRELAAGGEKIGFRGYFRRFSWIISPPSQRVVGGKFLFPPHLRGVWGGN